MKKILFSQIIFILALVVSTATARAVVVDKIVAVVNDEVITQREVATYLMRYFEEYRREYTGRRLEMKMLEAEDEVIGQLIEDKLILSEAKHQGVTVSNRDIEERLDDIKSNFKTDEEFRNRLAMDNVSLSELRERIKGDIMKQRLIRQALGWKIMITPIEAREYFEEHSSDYEMPARTRVTSILIKKEKRGRATGEARSLADNIKGLIEDGSDFAELAKEYSEGPHASEGGVLGWIKKGEMIEELDKAVFNLAEGEVSGVVESPLGYHIFKVLETEPAQTPDFQSVKDEINDIIYKERIERSLADWLKELRNDAYISVK